MAFIGTQVALNSVTPTALYAFNATNPGSVTDPVPVVVSCAASDIYVGGPNVTTSTGYLLKAGNALSLQVFGSSEILYAIVAGSTPSASVLLGRQ